MLKYFNPVDDPKMVGVNVNLMFLLDNARKFAGIPFYITSGVRTKDQNFACGGVSDSAHLSGLAVDIACLNDEQAYCIISGAMASGFKRIGLGKGHIHLDIDTTKPQKVLWVEQNAD